MTCSNRKTFGAGDTTYTGITYTTQSAVTGAKIPLDVTGWSFGFGVYTDDLRSPVGGAAVTVATELADASFVAGYVVLQVPGAMTDALSPGNYQLRVRATDGAGNSRTDAFPITLSNGGAV